MATMTVMTPRTGKSGTQPERPGTAECDLGQPLQHLFWTHAVLRADKHTFTRRRGKNAKSISAVLSKQVNKANIHQP